MLYYAKMDIKLSKQYAKIANKYDFICWKIMDLAQDCSAIHYSRP